MVALRFLSNNYIVRSASVLHAQLSAPANSRVQILSCLFAKAKKKAKSAVPWRAVIKRG
jgi:hypothetical protein